MKEGRTKKEKDKMGGSGPVGHSLVTGYQEEGPGDHK